jgi:TatD DNase family protein
MLIDSHVNLHAPQFDEDREAVIARARQAGIGLMLTICDKLSSLDAITAIAQANDDIWATVGVHPHEAKDYVGLTAERLAELAAPARMVGIGETGLDYHYDLSPRDQQRAVFAAHIAAAQSTGLPLVVHTREADEDMASMLEEAHARQPFKILMHCYTSGAELARRAAALGAWFSVSGIATFKAAEDVRAVIAEMPGERIIVETDCPYLAPVPMRGRRNEPAFLPHVLAKLADIRGWTLLEAEARTTDAFFDLFDRIPRPASLDVPVEDAPVGRRAGVAR